MSNRWAVVGKLKRVVKRITFLLNININRWRVASMLGPNRRRLSFNDRPGLQAALSDEENVELAVSPVSSSKTLSRTTSCPISDQDDINKKADIFIANFYRQLRMERQVSMQLKYCRGTSFSSSSPSPI